MCPDSQRADALNLVTLVENIARLSTQGLFGFVFASLAGVGKAYATFFCNAVRKDPSHRGDAAPNMSCLLISMLGHCHGRHVYSTFLSFPS